MSSNEGMYRRILEAIPDGIWVVNPQGATIFCNERMAQILGTDTESLQRMSCFDPVFPGDLEEAQRQFGLQMSGPCQPFDFRLRRVDGKAIWVSISCQPMYDEAGVCTALLGLFTDISERRRAEREQQDSETRFRAIFFQAAVGIAQTAPDGRWLLLNDRFCEMLGYSPAELRGKTFLDVTHPDDCEASLAAVRQLLAGKIPAWSKEKRYVRKDGATVWGRVFISLVRNQAGEPQYFITVVEDITEKIEAERALRETEQRLTLAQNAAYLGVWDRNLKTDVITVCGKYAELHGLPPDRTTLTRGEWFGLIHPDDRERVRVLINEARDRTRAFDSEFRVVWPDGTVHWLWAKGTVLADEAGHPIRSMGIVGDITERKQADAALRESEERFWNMADTAPVMIWVSGLDKLCTFFNKPWLEFTGRTLEQEMGNGWASGVHPADLDRCVTTYHSSFDARHAFQMEYRLRRADGTYRWVLDNGIPLYRGGDFAGFIGSCIDITGQKLIEERLRESEERLRRAERLAHVGNWHWDLKNNQLSWSEEMFAIFGQIRGYVPSYEGLLQAVVSEDRERVSRELSEALANKRGFSSEARIFRPNGEQRTITFTAEVLLDEEGLLAGMFGAIQDITDSKKNQAALLQSQESLRALTARLVDLQESGMRELARELHDDLSQDLAALGVEISTLVPPSGKPQRSFFERIREVRVRIMNLANDVHAMSRRLHPAVLEELGLEAALRQECIGFTERTGLPSEFEIKGALEPLSKDARLCFYRVAQESLRNIAKHAGAASVRMTLSLVNNRCTLRITDDGKGFDPSTAKPKNALGLISMQERVRLVNGNLMIKSEPGQGTTLEVSVMLDMNPRQT